LAFIVDKKEEDIIFAKQLYEWQNLINLIS